MDSHLVQRSPAGESRLHADRQSGDVSALIVQTRIRVNGNHGACARASIPGAPSRPPTCEQPAGGPQSMVRGNLLQIMP